MHDLSWQLALILTLIAGIVVCLAVTLGYIWYEKVQIKKRQNRRLFQHGHLYSVKSVK